MKIRVVVCTHNPVIEKLTLALLGIKSQILENMDVQVIVIDNGSTPKISKEVSHVTNLFAFEYHLLDDANLTKARIYGINLVGIEETDFILFVDDDNYLDSRYLQHGLSFMTSHKDVGIVAGKSLALNSLPRKNYWARQYLAIRDLGDEVLISKEFLWETCDPHGAGMLASQQACLLFAKSHNKDESLSKLGRSGSELRSGEDSFFAQLVKHNGLHTAYLPTLELHHDVGPERLSFKYLLRLAKGMGQSDWVISQVLGYPEPQWIPQKFRMKLAVIFHEIKTSNLKHGIYKSLRHIERARRKN